MPVRLNYEHNPSKATGPDIVHIGTPEFWGAWGKMFGGETFGVIEKKVASVLGPLLGKGLIRLDAKVRKGLPNVSSNRLLFSFIC